MCDNKKWCNLTIPWLKFCFIQMIWCLYKQPLSRSVKALIRKMEKLHSKYVFAPADKAANNVIIIWKRYYVDVLKGELNSTSTSVADELTKDKPLLHHIDTLTKINVKIDKCELLHFTGCQRYMYTKILINHVSYQILATALLPFFQSILHPL